MAVLPVTGVFNEATDELTCSQFQDAPSLDKVRPAAEIVTEGDGGRPQIASNEVGSRCGGSGGGGGGRDGGSSSILASKIRILQRKTAACLIFWWRSAGYLEGDNRIFANKLKGTQLHDD